MCEHSIINSHVTCEQCFKVWLVICIVNEPSRDGLQIWRVAVNISNKQLWTADEGWSPRLGVRWGTNNSP